MNFLPIEIKLEILQCLNYDQLFTLKKTNSHLYYLINRYERTLARMEFLKMEITASFSYPIRGVIDSEDGMDPTPYPNPGVIEFGIFDLPFANLIKKAKLPSEEIKMKCQTSIDRRIPIYLCTNEPKEMFFISLIKRGFFQNQLLIKLPTFPNNVDEMLFVYYWLEQLFYTSFVQINFNVLLNPELIKLLFENKTTKIPLQFYCNSAYLRVTNYNCKSLLDFVQNYLFADYFIDFNFRMVENTEKYNDILLKILLLKGGQCDDISFKFFRSSSLFDLIINHIETTTNFSNKLPCISFDNISWPHLDLKERVEIIETREYEDFSSTRYKLTNKYNPKMRVSITHEVSSGGIINIFIGKFMT
ncbi:hypothetical protein ACQ4LE_009790 [Meloidogyne hapla]